jgi:replicative superfamily II helicase
MKSQENSLLTKFMEAAIKRIDRSSANIYAIQQILIEKGIATQEEIISKNHDAENLPERKIGEKVLQDMLKDFIIEKGIK